MPVTEAQVLDALRAVRDPDLGRDIVTLNFVKSVKICDGVVGVTIELTTPACPVKEQMKREAMQRIAAIDGVREVHVEMTAQVRPTKHQTKEAMIPGVKNVIPVGSGKGGVGKSTVAANLALALEKLGARVGLMDADVYGPSIPGILGVRGRVLEQDGKMVPLEKFGIKAISMGFFLADADAAIMRGPMLHKAMEQFLGHVHWGDLDYLLVDLPPGTGDVQLSICQIVPITGAVVVSTPQDVALRVAQKAITMFRKLQSPILGLVENMSYFHCTRCGHREEIFGSGGVRRYCLMNGVPFLGEIPLATEIRTTADAGDPVVHSAPDSETARAFLQVAQNMAAQVSVQALGGGSGLTPMEVSQPARDRLRIKWRDGRETEYRAHELRLACRCATCVDEATGRKILQPESVPKDVWAVAINPVGRYALHIQWSDGHSTGLYTFEHLRELGRPVS